LKTKEFKTMRKLMPAILIFAAVGFATLTTSAPAAAYDYPWCVQGWGVDIPGDCSYRTYAQCMASASGRNAWCAENPRAALAQVRRGRYVYPPH
jgi:hypothetical protein